AALAEVVLEVLEDAGGDVELLVFREAVELLGAGDFLVAERRAVGGVGALQRWSAVGDMAVDDDQRRSAGRLLERPERTLEHRQVVGVADANDVPPIRDEPRGDVFAEAPLRVALDADLVVVVDPAEVIELEVPGEAGRFALGAF